MILEEEQLQPELSQQESQEEAQNQEVVFITDDGFV
jgi:hypothetical protein